MEANRRRLIIAAVVAIVTVVLAVVATTVVLLLRSSTEEHGTDAHEPHPDPFATAEGAASMVIGQIFSWRPAEQEGQWDSLHATAAHLTGPLAVAARERPDPEPLPREWMAWAEANDTIVGAVEVDSDQVDPHAAEGQVRLVVRQVVQHYGGGTTPLPEMTILVRMVNEGHAWKAAEYRISEIK